MSKGAARKNGEPKKKIAPVLLDNLQEMRTAAEFSDRAWRSLLKASESLPSFSAAAIRTLLQQHFVPLTFFPSFPLPIFAKSRGVPSGERDFAKIGRGKEGRRRRKRGARGALPFVKGKNTKIIKF